MCTSFDVLEQESRVRSTHKLPNFQNFPAGSGFYCIFINDCGFGIEMNYLV